MWVGDGYGDEYSGHEERENGYVVIRVMEGTYVWFPCLCIGRCRERMGTRDVSGSVHGHETWKGSEKMGMKGGGLEREVGIGNG